MNPAYDFTGQVALVTGAAAGMGLDTARALAASGAAVVLSDVDEQALRAATDELTAAGHRALGDVAAAVRDLVPEGVDALLDVVNYAPGTYDAALKEGARVASPTGAAGEGPGRSMVMAAPTAANLQRLGALLADGILRVPVQATYELDRAPEGLAALPGQHTQGKLAIRVS
jgi:NADPH2:quinone reductase